MEDQKNECEQVVKAFECCRHNEEESTCKYCKECPAGTWELAEEELNCIQSVYVRAAALINRQKAEIDRLSVELEAMRGAANYYKMHYEKAKSEDLVDTATVKKWLYQIAINNVGCVIEGDFSNSCEEIISRLDGLKRFAQETKGE